MLLFYFDCCYADISCLPCYAFRAAAATGRHHQYAAAMMLIFIIILLSPRCFERHILMPSGALAAIDDFCHADDAPC